jgi:hypothetical protein
MVLINSFDRECIQRIEIAPPNARINVLDSFLTDTYDLFILTQVMDGYEHVYNLYMIDLDESNPNKQGHYNKRRIPYKMREPIFSYTGREVDNRQFCKLYVRGSSRKEEYSRNQKQFVYFHHKGLIYYWLDLFSN